MKRSVSATDLRRMATIPPATSAARHVSTPHSSAASDRIGGVPHEAPDTGRRLVLGAERKWVRVSEPSRQRLLPDRPIHPGEVPRMHPDERRRAWTAIQELIATSDGEVRGLRRIGLREGKRHNPSRVRQIPNDQRAVAMRGARQRRHVVHAPGVVIDVGEQQHGGSRSQFCTEAVGVGQDQVEAGSACERLGNVKIALESS